MTTNRLKANILPRVRQYPKAMLRLADALPGCRLRWSARGVPHAVKLGEGSYSVCWFGEGRFYRVFWPYPSEYGQRPVTKTDFATVAEVVWYLGQGGR